MVRAFTLLLILGTAVPRGQAAEPPRDPYRTIDEIKRAAGPVPKQAEALTRLAWPDNPDDFDRELATVARDQLVDYAADALPALRQALRRVPESYQLDVVATLISAAKRVTSDLPSNYLPGLEDAIWFGGFEAKRLAIGEITRHRYRPALVTIMDAAYEYPDLSSTVCRSLGLYGDDRARHFLHTVLREGRPEESLAAARALARIGGRAMGTVKDAMLEDNEQARRSAVLAYLPISEPGDLSRLYEVLARYPDSDAELQRKITERAQLLEVLLERQAETAAATVVD